SAWSRNRDYDRDYDRDYVQNRRYGGWSRSGPGLFDAGPFRESYDRPYSSTPYDRFHSRGYPGGYRRGGYYGDYPGSDQDRFSRGAYDYGYRGGRRPEHDRDWEDRLRQGWNRLRRGLRRSFRGYD